MSEPKGKSKSASAAGKGRSKTTPVQAFRNFRQNNRKVIVTGESGIYTSLGYRSARIANKEGRTATGASGDRHAQYDRLSLIKQSRRFMRDNGIYKGMIERAVSYTAGNGFTLQGKEKSSTYNEKVEKLWRQWWRRPEIRGLLSGRGVGRMICRELLVAGDTGIVKTNKSLIQLIESEQICSKTGGKSDGIDKNTYGTPEKYWVAPYAKRSGFILRSKIRPIKPKNFIFITETERPSATRGVPVCQASFPMLHRINDVCDSEAIAWQMLARIAVSVTQKEGGQIAWNESRADPNKSDDELEGDLATRLIELNYALMFHAEPGEDIKGIDHNIPGKNFPESLRMFLRLLGLPIGLPLELILLDWTKSNYSQSRAVLEQAYQTFIGWQQQLVDFFYRPILEWKIEQWADQGLLGRKKAPYGFEHEWIGATFPWIDQLKEAQAHGAKVDRGFTTHSQVCKALSSDRGDVVDGREKEIRDAIKRAKKIEEDTGVKIDWQILAGMDPPKKERTKEKDEDDKGVKDDEE